MLKKNQFFIRLITLGDQLCFSVANFLLSIILARFYSEVELSAYVIGLSIVLTIQGLQRSCYVVQNAVLAPEILRRRASKVMGQQFIVWGALVTIQSLVTACLFVYSDNTYYHFVAVSTIVSTLIYTQLEFDRVIFIKHDKYMHAAAASIGFLIFTGVMFFIVPAYEVSFLILMGLVGAYMVLKMVWLFYATVFPDLFWGMRLLKRDLKRNLVSSVIGVIGYSGHNHIPVMVLGWYAAPLQTAVFGAMRGLMQPLQIIIRSLDIVDKNLFQKNVRIAGNMRHVLIRQLMIYGGLSILVIIATLLFGKWIIYFSYGTKYMDYDYILVGWSFIFSMLAITYPLETVIIQLNALNKYNYSRIISGFIGIILSLMLWEPYGAMGAIIACLAGWSVSILFAVRLVAPVLCGKEES